MTIKHAFTSSRPDPVDSLLVKPSDWNADHVVDEIICSGHSAMGKGGLIDRGAYFYSGDPVKSVLNIFETFSGDITSYTGFLGGLFILTEADQGGNSPSNMLFGADIEAMTNVANNKSIGGICGGNFSGHHFGSGLLTELIGVEAAARNGGPGSVSKAVGIDAYVSNYGGGSITNSYGFYFPAVYNKNSIITNNYGVRIDDQSYYNNLNGGTITNNYGIYIGDQSGLGSSSWNIYSAGVSSKNYFQGNVGIGTAVATQKLSIQSADTNPYISLDTAGTPKWFIGKEGTQAERFVIYEYGLDYRLCILAGGNVGIGTVSPAVKLEVSGPTITGSPWTAECFRWYSSTWPTIYGSLWIDGSGAHTGISIGALTHRSIFIDGTNGNVGIGTVGPGSKLSVVGLPGATAGLGPGDIWVDAAAGNVLKIV